MSILYKTGCMETESTDIIYIVNKSNISDDEELLKLKDKINNTTVGSYLLDIQKIFNDDHTIGSTINKYYIIVNNLFKDKDIISGLKKILSDVNDDFLTYNFNVSKYFGDILIPVLEKYNPKNSTLTIWSE